MCFSKNQPNSPPAEQKMQQSEKKKKRDKERLHKYLESKRLMRELPFSNVRVTAFLNTMNITECVKSELNCIKKKLKEQQTSSEKQINELKENLKHSEHELKQQRTISQQRISDLERRLQEVQHHNNVPGPSENRSLLQEYVNENFKLHQDLDRKNNLMNFMAQRYNETCVEHMTEISKERQEKENLVKQIQDFTTLVDNMKTDLDIMASENNNLKFQIQQCSQPRHFGQQRFQHYGRFQNRGHYR